MMAISRTGSHGARPALQTMETRKRRFRKRTQEEIELIELMRELEWLARKYGRFSHELWALRHRVKSQLGSADSKRALVMSVLRKSSMPLDLDEVVAESGLDKHSATAALGELTQNHLAQEINREGKDPRKTKSGRPTDRVYYRAAPLRPLPD